MNKLEYCVFSLLHPYDAEKLYPVLERRYDKIIKSKPENFIGHIKLAENDANKIIKHNVNLVLNDIVLIARCLKGDDYARQIM